MGRITFPTFLLLISVFLSCGKNEKPKEIDTPSKEQESPATQPLFELLPSSKTGITFQNVLTEGLNTNVLLYEYFYNGGGVAASDFNGDDLIDLYFTSNMGTNALYINQGDLTFQEVGELSGAQGRKGPWKTGVTAVDINGDNRMDIYLCYSGNMPEPKRANQLFINQGNNEQGIPMFEEQASTYGLASPAFSNQGHFFDYDRDGDLDMILLNHNPKSLPVLNEASTALELEKDDPLKGIRLFRQSQGKFRDVTEQTGIVGSGLCYGLGIGISDVNNDGWMDFYVSNDYDIPDYLYINNKDGSFRDQLANNLGHNSHFSMGNDIADVNNDGLVDIITLDMLPEDNRRQKLLMAPENYAKFDLNLRSGFHYQYMRNMLQLNNGNGTFSEIGQLAGVSNTDWSWAALLADYDNDGWKDLFITNGYFRDYSNRDFINYMETYRAVKGRLTRQDVLEIIKEMPSSNVINYMYSNQGGNIFKNQTREWGLSSPSNSNGAAYADLDNDGDLDLIVNNINQPAFIYQNTGRERFESSFLQIQLQGEKKNTQGIGARVRIISANSKQVIEQNVSRGYLSAISPILHMGLGQENIVDTLEINWPSGKSQVLTGIQANQVLTLKENEARKMPVPPLGYSPTFTQIRSPISLSTSSQNILDFDRQPLLIQELSYSGPVIKKEDLDGNGKEDLMAGGGQGEPIRLFLQSGSGRFSSKTLADFELHKNQHTVDMEVLDANGDGKKDLYVANGGYHQFAPRDSLLQDRLYLGDGKGNFTWSKNALPVMPVSTGSVAVCDINQDGFEDLFVGGRLIPGRYPEVPQSFILINDGSGNLSDKTEEWSLELKNIGMVSSAKWVDLDQDEQKELIVVGEWMGIKVFGIEGNKLHDISAQFFEEAYRGWWNTLEVIDVNNDKKPDLVLGNMGTNTQVRASPTQPAEMYYADFDENGAIDPLLCFYIQGNSYPYLTRDELTRQLAGMRQRFPDYKSYADVTIHEIFSQAQLAEAGHHKATHLETLLFLNQGNGKMKAKALPIQAQYAPVYTVTELDYNQDGNADLLLCGNNNHTKLRLGKMDANYGILLKGDGLGNFQYLPQRQCGFQLKGDVRSVVLLEDLLLFGVNEEKIVAYKKARNL